MALNEEQIRYKITRQREDLVNRLSVFQFNGEDEEQPAICHWFGCCRKLTHTEQLYGKFCVHHQNRKPFDVTQFISY